MTKMTWEEFRDARLFWWINRILHLFGISIVFEEDDSGKVTDVYPARISWRGFETNMEELGFEDLTHFMDREMKRLKDEVK